MEWKKGRESTNVVDSSAGYGNSPGLAMRLTRIPFGIGGLIVIILGALALGVDPVEILSLLSGGGADSYSSQPAPATTTSSSDPQVEFVRRVLGSTEDVWASEFEKRGSRYQPAQLALFREHTHSGCGYASQAMGPFYCSRDERVYLDLHFFDELASRFRAKGEFAAAYVVAHEIGHHVQKLLGSTEKAARLVERGSPMEGADGVSVRLELQADCLAGVWANRSQEQLQWLQSGDIDSALNAANQIGDDTLERRSQGIAVPDSFTHGTSAQRVGWFKRGLTAGDIESCDTFTLAPRDFNLAR